MSKITRKSYKRKKIIMGFALFGAIGLVSTGFAAWVLSGSASKDSESTLNVGTVSDKSMGFGDVDVYATGDAGKTEIHTYSFEPPVNDSTGRVRSDGVSVERLSLTVETSITQAQNLGKLTATISVENVEAGNDYEAAVSKGYVVLPEAAVAPVVLYDASVSPINNAGGLTFAGDAEKTASFTYNVGFAWGAFFGEMNPSLFFDSEELGGASGTTKGVDFEDDDVKDTLDELHDLLDGVKLTLTLTADPN